MHFWMAIIVLALISSVVKIARARYGVADDCGSRGRMGDAMRRPAFGHDPENDRLRDEVKMLKDRIAVLERITTENDHSLMLDREIEKLRTQPAK